MSDPDYRNLPPLPTDRLDITVDDVGLCQGCGHKHQVTSTVVYPVLCSSCISSLPQHDGMVIRRNMMPEPEPVSSYSRSQEDWFRRVRNVQDYGTPDPLNRPVSTAQRISELLAERAAYHEAADASYQVSTAPKTSEAPPAFRPPESPDDRILGPKYVYDPLRDRKPRLGDSPRTVYDYITANYTPQEIKERYSEIRDELLYPNPKTITVTLDDESFIKDLTAAAESHILKVPPEINEEEEQPVAILSREEAEAAYKRAAGALAEIDRLEKKYSPDLPDGSVVAFRLSFPGTPTNYCYAAVRAVGKWFCTGKVSEAYPVGVGIGWEILLAVFEQFSDDAQFEVLRTGGEVKELATGPTQRSVVLPDGARTDAFDEPTDEHDTIRGKVVTGDLADLDG